MYEVDRSYFWAAKESEVDGFARRCVFSGKERRG